MQVDQRNIHELVDFDPRQNQLPPVHAFEDRNRDINPRQFPRLHNQLNKLPVRCLSGAVVAAGAAGAVAGLLGGGFGAAQIGYNKGFATGLAIGNAAAAQPNYNAGYKDAWDDIGPLTQNYSSNSLSPVALGRDVEKCISQYSIQTEGTISGLSEINYGPHGSAECRVFFQVIERNLTTSPLTQQIPGLLAQQNLTNID